MIQTMIQKNKPYLTTAALFLTFISSLFLSAGYWSKISSFLVFVALGLEITKLAVFLEIPTRKILDKVNLIFVGLILSATSVYTSAEQIKYLFNTNYIVTEQANVDYEGQKSKVKRLESAIRLKEKAIEKDIEANYRGRAQTLQEELIDLHTQIDKVKVSTPKSAAKNHSDLIYWVLAGVLDLIIITLSHLLQRCDSKQIEMQKEVKTLKDNNCQKEDGFQENDLVSKMKSLIENGHPIRSSDLRQTLKVDMSKICTALQELHANGYLNKNGRCYALASA